jgi:hypothetical protein
MPQKKGSESGGTQRSNEPHKRIKNTRGTKHYSQGEVRDMSSQSSSKKSSYLNKDLADTNPL